MKCWVARDKDGMLYLYGTKPQKNKYDWKVQVLSPTTISRLPKEWYPEVRWEDEEPLEIIVEVDYGMGCSR